MLRGGLASGKTNGRSCQKPHCRAARCQPTWCGTAATPGQQHQDAIQCRCWETVRMQAPTSRTPGSAPATEMSNDLVTVNISPTNEYFILNLSETPRKVAIELMSFFVSFKNTAKRLTNEGRGMSTPLRMFLQRLLSASISAGSGQQVKHKPRGEKATVMFK